MHTAYAYRGLVDDDLDSPPSVSEMATECRRLIEAFDDVAPADMDWIFYAHAYEELRLNLGLLLDALERARRR